MSVQFSVFSFQKFARLAAILLLPLSIVPLRAADRLLGNTEIAEGSTLTISGAIAGPGLDSALEGAGDARYSALGHTHTFLSIASKPTTLSGYGITDAQPIDPDLTAIAAVTGTGTIYYRSAANTWSPITIGTGLSFVGGTLAATGGGGGSGDMAAATYDPQNIAGDAFDRANHTGEQAISTVTGLQDALDAKIGSDVFDVSPSSTKLRRDGVNYIEFGGAGKGDGGSGGVGGELEGAIIRSGAGGEEGSALHVKDSITELFAPEFKVTVGGPYPDQSTLLTTSESFHWHRGNRNIRVDDETAAIVTDGGNALLESSNGKVHIDTGTVNIEGTQDIVLRRGGEEKMRVRNNHVTVLKKSLKWVLRGFSNDGDPINLVADDSTEPVVGGYGGFGNLPSGFTVTVIGASMMSPEEETTFFFCRQGAILPPTDVYGVSTVGTDVNPGAAASIAVTLSSNTLHVTVDGPPVPITWTATLDIIEIAP